MIALEKDGLQLELSGPGETYKGTRFDHSGVFHRIVYQGKSFAGKWYDSPEDPFRHDNVRGCSEEFLGVIPVADGWLKLGVGILSDDRSDGVYDWFHTYPVIREGVRSLEVSSASATFMDTLEGFYSLGKTVRITGEGEFEIAHRLENLSVEPLAVLNYNHNFFTLGLPSVGRGRRITMPRPFTGHWREDSVGAVLKGRSLVMTDGLSPAQKACMLDIRMPGEDYGFTLEGENGLGVEVFCDRPLHHAQFWANSRVACMEPFVSARPAPREVFSWTIRYRLFINPDFSLVGEM